MLLLEVRVKVDELGSQTLGRSSKKGPDTRKAHDDWLAAADTGRDVPMGRDAG